MTVDAFIRPEHIVAGIGSADRAQLATFLAVVEEASVGRLLVDRYQRAERWVRDWLDKNAVPDELPELGKRITEVAARISASTATDEELRIELWMVLREAFQLPPSVALSERASQQSAADLATAVLLAYEPDQKAGAPADFGEVVRRTLAALIGQALKVEPVDERAREAQRDALETMKGYLGSLGDKELKELLSSVNAEELTDDALRKLLGTAGGLAAFAAAVQVAGFSAYMLAATASTLIPFVGGAGMVSLVAVLANPLTVLALVGGLGYHWYQSANESAAKGVASALCCLLALAGLSRRTAGLRAFRDAFQSLENPVRSPLDAGLTSEVVEKYRGAWNQVKGVRFRRTDVGLVTAKALGRPAVEESGSLDRLLKRVLFPDKESAQTAAIAGLTIGDLIYQAAIIDPRVVQAADFSHTEDLSALPDFAAFAERVSSLGGKSLAGADAHLQGYVAERVVAEKLVALGHQVSMPETSNQPGWDLLVDGQEFQVKCVDSLGQLREHFGKYDYPVFVNSELGEQLGELDPALAAKVYLVEGYSQAFTNEITERSLAAGDELMNPDIPMFAVVVCAARQIYGWSRGEVTAQDAVAEVMLNGSVRAGLATFGGLAGKTLGLLLLGPAGALVGTTAVPLVLQTCAPSTAKWVRDSVPSDRRDAWNAEVHEVLDELVRACTNGLEKKLDMLRDKCRSVGRGPLGKFMRGRIEEDALFLKERLAQAAGLHRVELEDVDVRHRAVMEWVMSTTVHPARLQDAIKRLGALFEKRPGFWDAIAKMVGFPPQSVPGHGGVAA